MLLVMVSVSQRCISYDYKVNMLTENPLDGDLVLFPADVTAELGSNVTFDGVGTANCNDCGRYSWRTIDPDENFISALAIIFNTRGQLNSATYNNVQFFDPDNTDTFATVQVSYDYGGTDAALGTASLTVVGECTLKSRRCKG